MSNPTEPESHVEVTVSHQERSTVETYESHQERLRWISKRLPEVQSELDTLCTDREKERVSFINAQSAGSGKATDNSTNQDNSAREGQPPNGSSIQDSQLGSTRDKRIDQLKEQEKDLLENRKSSTEICREWSEKPKTTSQFSQGPVSKSSAFRRDSNVPSDADNVADVVQYVEESDTDSEYEDSAPAGRSSKQSTGSGHPNRATHNSEEVKAYIGQMIRRLDPNISRSDLD